jgi:1-aminocyclopropane-1-carboxylate deaminase/D-cysteine desulfhydrase-like pyridoxal-dependent ACC family enzyme
LRWGAGIQYHGKEMSCMLDKYYQKQFIDSNVLVYAHDLSAGVKCDRAKEIIP